MKNPDVSTFLLILVKAPLQVLYYKIQYERWGQVTYNTRQSQVLYFPRDPAPSAVYYHTTRVYYAFTDLLVLKRRTDCLCFELEVGRVDLQRC